MKITFVARLEEYLGIEYISAVLKEHGHSVGLVFDPSLFNFNHKDFNIKPLAWLFDIRKHLLEEVIEQKPDVVAFSVTSSNYLWSLEFAKQIKQLLNVPIVFGGIHPSAVPERVLKNKCVDFVIRGEGEYPMLELVNSLANGGPDYSIKNLCFRRNGDVTINDLRPLISPLDSLPFPDKDLFYNKGIPFTIGHMVVASRGCTHACTFCGNNIWRKIYFGNSEYMTNPKWLRWRSPDNVVRELKLAKEKYGVKIIRFNDDDLAVNPAWLEEFSYKYKREVNLPYKCFVMPSSIDKKTARWLAESNCQQAQMGFQSINPEIRAKLGRPMSNEVISKAISQLKENGIEVLTDNIFGLPWEREEDYWNLVDFYRKNPVDFINVFWLVYFPKADVVAQAIEAGIITKEMAERMEEEPFNGCIQNRADTHKDIPFKFKLIFEAMNYFPRWLSELFIKLKLYYLIPFNIFIPLKALGIILPKNSDRFPKPTLGYELFSFRYSALVRHYAIKNLLIKIKGIIKISLNFKKVNNESAIRRKYT